MHKYICLRLCWDTSRKLMNKNVLFSIAFAKFEDENVIQHLQVFQIPRFVYFYFFCFQRPTNTFKTTSISILKWRSIAKYQILNLILKSVVPSKLFWRRWRLRQTKTPQKYTNTHTLNLILTGMWKFTKCVKSTPKFSPSFSSVWHNYSLWLHLYLHFCILYRLAWFVGGLLCCMCVSVRNVEYLMKFY